MPEAFYARFPVSVIKNCDPREKPNTSRPVANETKLPVAREKKPLVPRVGDTAPKGPTV